jgi:hypothetical protein
MTHKILALMTALALVLPGVSSAQRTLADVHREMRHKETLQKLQEFYGSYRCGSETVTIDSSWKQTDMLGDGGIHYYVGKYFREDTPRGMRSGFIAFGFHPAHGSIPAETKLTRVLQSYSGEPPQNGEEWSWSCTRLQ